MWFQKITSRMKRNEIVKRGQFGKYDVEIVNTGGKFVVRADDFDKDLQGGVFSDYHATDSLEAAQDWAEKRFG